MDVSVVVPAFNASKTIDKCLQALSEQVVNFDFKIIVVDDGSKDNTAEIVRKYKNIIYLFQKNSGPAAARNRGWNKLTGDIVVFTDSDCVPESNWLAEMVKPFKISDKIGAVGGAYEKTVNGESRLARMIGGEIKFRYSNIGKYTDAHGSYSLAVKRKILEQLGGFNEDYPVATAEDWDLCYRIQDLGYKIYFNKNAKIGHHHPEKLIKYLKTQFRHGYYRIKLYKDNPKKIGGDKYSGNAKYIVGLSGLSLLFLFLSLFQNIYILGLLACLILLVLLNINLLVFLLPKNSILFTIEEILLQLCRGFAWFLGMITGMVNIFILKTDHDMS